MEIKFQSKIYVCGILVCVSSCSLSVNGFVYIYLYIFVCCFVDSCTQSLGGYGSLHLSDDSIDRFVTFNASFGSIAVQYLYRIESEKFG